MEIQKELRKFNVQIAVLIFTLVIYLLLQNPIIGIIIALEIFAFVGLEVKEGVKHHGVKHEIVDTVIALVLALLIWYGSAFLLHTPSPLSAVVSCSMLPNLQRGDFVIVQGSEPNVYEVSFSQSQFNDFFNGDVLVISEKFDFNKTVKGSMYSYCTFNINSDPACKSFVSDPYAFKETRGPMEFYYGSCQIKINGANLSQPCVERISFDKKNYLTNFSNDVVVYQPSKGDLFALTGDIVHRAFFKITSPNGVYYLIRGDNNPVLDIQIYDYTNQLGNHPVPAQQVKGKVLARVPLLGYFKLFISGFFTEPQQCKTQLSFVHV
ncbi:MAG: hypothetical protein Q7S22_01920 [Candidatus Micrarchaeota archaeon]|nr:hypothetical protein [Candidatus Micrarchaeota archaeon]